MTGTGDRPGFILALIRLAAVPVFFAAERLVEHPVENTDPFGVLLVLAGVWSLVTAAAELAGRPLAPAGRLSGSSRAYGIMTSIICFRIRSSSSGVTCATLNSSPEAACQSAGYSDCRVRYRARFSSAAARMFSTSSRLASWVAGGTPGPSSMWNASMRARHGRSRPSAALAGSSSARPYLASVLR